MIYQDEVNRSGLGGPATSLLCGMSYGVAPIYKFGNWSLQERFLPDLLTCKKRSCIAITGPSRRIFAVCTDISYQNRMLGPTLPTLSRRPRRANAASSTSSTATKSGRHYLEGSSVR
jgi:hypothetical protein